MMLFLFGIFLSFESLTSLEPGTTEFIVKEAVTAILWMIWCCVIVVIESRRS